MTNFNAKHLANNARDLINLLRTNTKATMAGTVVEWNTCVKQSGLTGTYDFPATGYTRKAQLIADLDRAAAQLDALAIEADRTAGRPVDEEGNDLREWCGNDIQADHAEALLINEKITAVDLQLEFLSATPMMQGVWVNLNHAEALELNELRDFRIDAPEPAQVARTAAITARLQSHIIAPVFILLMLLIGGSFNADAMMAGMLGSTMANLDSIEPVDSLKPAVPVEHWVCGGQQVSYDGKSLTVDGWRFTRPLEVVKKQPSVTRAVGFENTNRQIVMLITVEGTTIFAGDYYPEVACIK